MIIKHYLNSTEYETLLRRSLLLRKCSQKRISPPGTNESKEGLRLSQFETIADLSTSCTSVSPRHAPLLKEKGKEKDKEKDKEKEKVKEKEKEQEKEPTPTKAPTSKPADLSGKEKELEEKERILAEWESRLKAREHALVTSRFFCC